MHVPHINPIGVGLITPARNSVVVDKAERPLRSWNAYGPPDVDLTPVLVPRQ